MEVQDIRTALRRQPFESFSFRLADDRALPVRHPEFVAVGGARIVVILPDDSWDVVDPFQVVSLEYPVEKANAAKSNGRE